jgi:hypothetical protein
MKSIKDLREIMFETIDAVRAGTLSVDKANAVAGLAREMINSLKTEIDFRKQMNIKSGSDFLPDAVPMPPPRLAPVTPPPVGKGESYEGKLNPSRI